MRAGDRPGVMKALNDPFVGIQLLPGFAIMLATLPSGSTRSFLSYDSDSEPTVYENRWSDEDSFFMAAMVDLMAMSPRRAA